MGWRTICPGDRDDHITRVKDCFEGTDDLPTRPLGINVHVRGDLATGEEGRLLFCIHEELKLITFDQVAVGRCRLGSANGADDRAIRNIGGERCLNPRCAQSAEVSQRCGKGLPCGWSRVFVEIGLCETDSDGLQLVCAGQFRKASLF